MKYALLIYGSPEARDAPEDELRSVVGEYDALLEEPAVLAGQQLQGTESATTVRVQNGEALLSDGPFVDAKEYLGGFLLLEADDLDAATAMAARIPAARMGGAVEVRPIVER
ncbi:MAG TPA: YciI family protein [Thermoleophilaceae bacterium]|nr:YciI family protein [Thermoleophilaceae bacterium]